MNDPLERLARRIASDPFFLAAPLDRYANSESLDDTGLAAKLKCSLETLTRLRLCRNPEPQPPQFWQDVEAIAARFQADPEALAEVVRHGQALLRIQEERPARESEHPGFLMAARDADQPEPPPEPQS